MLPDTTCEMSWFDASSPGTSRHVCDVPQSWSVAGGGESFVPERSCCSGLSRLTAWATFYPPLSLFFPVLLLHQGTQTALHTEDSVFIIEQLKVLSLLTIEALFLFSCICMWVFLFFPGEGSGFRECQSINPVPTRRWRPGCWRHSCLCSELVCFISITPV